MTTHLQTSAADFLPAKRTLDAMRKAARSCRGCDIYKNATQTVFGEGPQHARLLFVGEQPGDIEDREGHPFVGPAGRLFDRAMEEADIPRDIVYVTNAVKHFKWIQRGKRRMHQKPLIRQVLACQPWLRAEVEIVRPKLVVCLGATAAQSVLGKVVRIGVERGKFLENEFAGTIFVTIHPSAILRQREKPDREKEYLNFLADMKLVRHHLE
jgi:uracil-DNA glycosylase